VDKINRSGKVRLTWSTDPFPEDDRFQWLKVKLPEADGYVMEQELAGAQSNNFYFAFTHTANSYSSFVRVPVDWKDWDSQKRVLIGPIPNSSEVFLLTDPLPGAPFEVPLEKTWTWTLGQLLFEFQRGSAQAAAVPALHRLQLRRGPQGLSLSWEANGVPVQVAPALSGPWRILPESSASRGALQLAPDKTQEFFRLAPITTPVRD
jgi:hypothetical protein